jgi:flagellar biosynthesis/type III secretory pathway protein FliH
MGNVTFGVEESIQRGGCLIETETLIVDATFQSQLHKILEAL